MCIFSRAAGRGGGSSRSEVCLSVSGMRGSRPRLTALAATLVFPLDSPLLRGVQRTLPLVAFLWRSGASRCRWQMQAQRLIRSRASGEPSRSRPAKGIAARRENRSFPDGKEWVLIYAGWSQRTSNRLGKGIKRPPQMTGVCHLRRFFLCFSSSSPRRRSHSSRRRSRSGRRRSRDRTRCGWAWPSPAPGGGPRPACAP